jgi:hypothetical protein
VFTKFWKKNGSGKKDPKDLYDEILSSEEGRAFVARSQAYVHSRGFKPDPYPALVVNGIIHRGNQLPSPNS